MSVSLTPRPRSWRYAVEIATTTLFWGLWAYLVMPLLSLLLWYFGIQIFVEEMIVLGGYQAFLEELGRYGAVVLAMLLATVTWVSWNVRRYGGEHNTRTHMLAAVTLMETADAAGLTPETIETLQQRRRLTVSFDDNDRLCLMD